MNIVLLNLDFSISMKLMLLFNFGHHVSWCFSGLLAASWTTVMVSLPPDDDDGPPSLGEFSYAHVVLPKRKTRAKPPKNVVSCPMTGGTLETQHGSHLSLPPDDDMVDFDVFQPTSSGPSGKATPKHLASKGIRRGLLRPSSLRCLSEPRSLRRAR